MTGKWQPLDVMVNRVFKSFYKAEYHKWRLDNNAQTKGGYLKKPGRQDFINMVSAAWEAVDFDTVRNSFVKAEIIDRNQISGEIGEEVVGDDENQDFSEMSFFAEEEFGEGSGDGEKMESDL
ncbi:hypothetical protein BV898_14199 [Hypsibius exemplaris]|uniref:DDE-1 domain-containing protein n=1 Tax=Hypsibius exemplaris TaxID=2072580 RepID=A0A1W0W8H7_HYPEX|nr:hypothetical protein BV898_14199 [Hypsibius exemplaris]